MSAPAQPTVMRTHYPMHIDGGSVDTADTFDLINPATGQTYATCARGTAADADAAVASAKASFTSGVWRSRTGAERAEVLERVADLLEADAERLAEIGTIENGAPIRVSRGFAVDTPVTHIRHFARLAREQSEETGVPPFGPVMQSAIIRREPIGVCAGIVPWNAPTTIAVWKAVPALAAGNSVVLKPDEKTPIGALHLAEAFLEAGLPAGVLNVVMGTGAEVGETLAAHRDVGKISFTGSTRTGQQVMRSAAANVKNLTLELGGKSANIVLDDADIELAVDGAIWGFLLHSGQTCESGTRLFLPDSIHDAFMEQMVYRLGSLRMGSPLDHATDLGPLISARQRATVNRYIDSAASEGATLAYQGDIPDDPDLVNGFWVAPRVFTGVDPGMTISREEIFGPVLSVIRYRDDDDAVRLANASEFGLAAGVWSSDVERALRVARGLEAGSVWINDWHNMTHLLPYGGYKQSGLGRELGERALDAFTETKAISIPLSHDLNRRSFAGVLSSPGRRRRGTI